MDPTEVATLSATDRQPGCDADGTFQTQCNTVCVHLILCLVNVGKRTFLSSLPLQYALSCFPRIEVAFVDALSVEANRAHFLDGCAGFPSYKKKKKKRAISLPEVILPSFFFFFCKKESRHSRQGNVLVCCYRQRVGEGDEGDFNPRKAAQRVLPWQELSNVLLPTLSAL